MTRPLGGYIGFTRVPTGEAASGVWTLREQERFKRAGTWPAPLPPITASLLLNFNGDNNSTTFTDSSPNNLSVTANGDAKISTAQSKFGGASGYFGESTGSYLSIGSSEAFEFGTGDFTFETWIRIQSNPGSFGIFETQPLGGSGGTRTNQWIFYYEQSANQFHVFANSENRVSASAAGALDNDWHHIALVRSSGTGTIYIDGNAVSSSALSVDVQTSSGALVGTFSDGSTLTPPGYFDDLRIVKGTAVYTANFTPPTSQLGVNP
jgi:hypothetical protein